MIDSITVSSYHVDNFLWTQQDLEEFASTSKEDIFLPTDIENEVLQSILVLMVTANINETSATHGYLQPLDGHKCIYQFVQYIRESGQNPILVIYYIGKYGSCPAAIRDIPPDMDMNGDVSMMANQCFPNLCAIISVGVAFGVGKNVKLCDVLVSLKIVNYEDEHSKYSPKVKSITVSPQLIKLFTQFVQWPNDDIRKRLNDNGLHVPNVKCGAVLNGTYIVDDPAIKIALFENFSEVMGIEMEETHLFIDTQQTMTNTIIIKAVCDFGDGKYNEMYQPTAALLAADLVHKCLSHPKAYEMLKGFCTIIYYVTIRILLS